jgi:hypothetical protein
MRNGVGRSDSGVARGAQAPRAPCPLEARVGEAGPRAHRTRRCRGSVTAAALVWADGFLRRQRAGYCERRIDSRRTTRVTTDAGRGAGAAGAGDSSAGRGPPPARLPTARATLSLPVLRKSRRCAMTELLSRSTHESRRPPLAAPASVSHQSVPLPPSSMGGLALSSSAVAVLGADFGSLKPASELNLRTKLCRLPPLLPPPPWLTALVPTQRRGPAAGPAGASWREGLRGVGSVDRATASGPRRLRRSSSSEKGWSGRLARSDRCTVVEDAVCILGPTLPID